jgi:hypothetical protein
MSNFLLLLLGLVAVTMTHGSSSSCQCGAPYKRSVDDSLLAAVIAVRIDAGPELRLDQYPYNSSSSSGGAVATTTALDDPQTTAHSVTNHRRYFHALVHRVFIGCDELEKHENVIISIPKNACADGIIAPDGTLELDLLFGTISSMTLPLEGTTQVLEVDLCQANAKMSQMTLDTRAVLRDYANSCYQEAAYPQNLRGSVDRQ